MTRPALVLVVCTLSFSCGGGGSPSQPSSPPPPPQESTPAKAIALTGSLDFGDVVLGTVATRTLTIRNTGTSELKVSGVTLPDRFASDWQAFRAGTIAPNAEAAVIVYFAPDGNRSYAGSLTVAADNTSGTNTLAVSGRGVFTPGPTADRIPDPEVVQNIIDQNQNMRIGNKEAGVISRWELPLPVYLGPDVEHQFAIAALDYLAANAGISYVLVPSSADPVVVVSSGTLGGTAGAVGGISSVFGNNRSRRGFVTIGTQNVPCRYEDCMNMYRHELMHVLGIFGHLSYPPQPPYVPSGGGYPFKEIAVLRALYALPHGTRVNADGTWQVVR